MDSGAGSVRWLGKAILTATVGMAILATLLAVPALAQPTNETIGTVAPEAIYGHYGDDIIRGEGGATFSSARPVLMV